MAPVRGDTVNCRPDNSRRAQAREVPPHAPVRRPGAMRRTAYDYRRIYKDFECD